MFARHTILLPILLVEVPSEDLGRYAWVRSVAAKLASEKCNFVTFLKQVSVFCRSALHRQLVLALPSRVLRCSRLPAGQMPALSPVQTRPGTPTGHHHFVFAATHGGCKCDKDSTGDRGRTDVL